MADKIIAKTDLRNWVKSMAAENDVIAPMPREGAPSAWKDVDGTQDIEVGTNEMLMAVKEYLLPPYETLFTVNAKKGEESITHPIQNPKSKIQNKVMIGLKLCDVKAISVLDAIYLKQGPFQDPYYAARRENLALIATVCDDPRWSCFCTSVGNLDEWRKSADVMITDLGDKIYVEPTTDTGEKLTQGDFFKSPSPEDTAKKSEVWTKLLALPKRSFAGQDITAKVNWEEPIWAEMAKKCLGCGICSYMCPSCSCFDIQDETIGSTIERYRCRDTCQSCDFTLMGAGHNPRPEKTMRVRQRVMHKFKYQPEQYSLLGCTGCGRCVESCPVNIDMREIISRIMSEP